MDTLSQWLQTEIESKGWSQRELARRAGISHTTVSEILNDRKNVTWDFCAAIARPLEKTPMELFQMAGLLPGGGNVEAARAEYYVRSITDEEIELIESWRALPLGPAREYLLKLVRGWVKENARG